MGGSVISCDSVDTKPLRKGREWEGTRSGGRRGRTRKSDEGREREGSSRWEKRCKKKEGQWEVPTYARTARDSGTTRDNVIYFLRLHANMLNS